MADITGHSKRPLSAADDSGRLIPSTERCGHRRNREYPTYPMEWHYAEGQEKRGPLPEAEMQSLIAAGRIRPDTLVWNPSFAQWKPARESGFFIDATGEPTTQVYLITGKNFPVSQMIKTQHGWVS